MGPSVKFVLAIIDSISKKKWGLIFFRKIGHEGGGVRGLRVCSRKNYLSSFLNISLRPSSSLIHSIFIHIPCAHAARNNTQLFCMTEYVRSHFAGKFILKKLILKKKFYIYLCYNNFLEHIF